MPSRPSISPPSSGKISLIQYNTSRVFFENWSFLNGFRPGLSLSSMKSVEHDFIQSNLIRIIEFETFVMRRRYMTNIKGFIKCLTAKIFQEILKGV